MDGGGDLVVSRYADSVVQAEKTISEVAHWSHLGHRKWHQLNHNVMTLVWRLFYLHLLQPPALKVRYPLGLQQFGESDKQATRCCLVALCRSGSRWRS